jgi:hypothetical protein
VVVVVVVVVQERAVNKNIQVRLSPVSLKTAELTT